jgi:hypothetical protein
MAKIDDSDLDERPAKKKKKKKKAKGGFPVVIVAVIAVIVLLLGGAGAGLTYFLTRPRPEPQAKIDPKPEPPRPGNLGVDVVKRPKTLLGNIRARGAQIERDAEMIGIVRLYHAYCDEVKNPNARNLDGFLRSIRSEPAKIVNAVKSKEYLINYKARVSSDDIVVYESEEYDLGYFCFRANNQSDYVPAQELKAAGLLAPAEQDQKK